ncbi:MAG: hypothetical protein ACYC2U_00620 [Candidatus Amoebophilus sp.]
MGAVLSLGGCKLKQQELLSHNQEGEVESLTAAIDNLSIKGEIEQEISHLLQEAEQEENADQKTNILVRVLHLGLKSDNQEAIEQVILQADASNPKLYIRDIVFYTLRELVYMENKEIQLEDAIIKLNNAIISKTYNSNLLDIGILNVGIVEEDVKFLSELQLALQNIHCTASPEYDFNKILISSILYFAHLAIDASPEEGIDLEGSSYKDIAGQAFKFLRAILDDQAIILEVKVLQDIQRSLVSFYNKDYRQICRGKGVFTIKGIGAVTRFIEQLKQYVPRKRDYHSDSEGESESEDDSIVYRALRVDEDPSRGLFSKGQKTTYSLVEHINPWGLGCRTNSPWISTTRSLKIAAAWSSKSACKEIAKIKMDNAWREQECDHVEPGKRKIYDFTNQENINLFFLNKRDTRARNTAVSSQEVSIYREIPKENILALYTADILSDKAYQDLKGKTKDELASQGIYNIVKTRSTTYLPGTDKFATPKPIIIKTQDIEKYKASSKAGLIEGLVETIIIDQASTGKEAELSISSEELAPKVNLDKGKDKMS